MSEQPNQKKQENPDLNVFYIYAKQDETLQNRLVEKLEFLKEKKIINEWYYRQITAEDNWKNQVDYRLNKSQIIFLLVSPNFIASDYCSDAEIKKVMELHQTQKARVIPIILDSVDLNNLPFADLKALPSNGIPVKKWDSPNKAFENITQGIRTIAKEITNSTSGNASRDVSTSIFYIVIFLFGLAVFALSNPQSGNISETPSSESSEITSSESSEVTASESREIPRSEASAILSSTEIRNSTGWIQIGQINKTLDDVNAEESLLEAAIEPAVIPSLSKVVTIKDEVDLLKEKSPSPQVLQKLQPGEKVKIFNVEIIPKSSQDSSSQVWAQVRKCDQTCQ